MSVYPVDLAPFESEARELPVLRVADNAIGLWQAAEALGDPALLETLRPLLMQVARILARDIMEADEDEMPN